VRRLALVLFDGSVVSAPAEAVLAMIPEDERPLRGEAGQLDWRLDGEISRLLESGYVTGSREEAALLPGGPMIGAVRVMLIGVGGGDDLAGRNLQRALRAVLPKLVALRVHRVALALPAAIEPALDADDLLWGLVSGLAALPEDSELVVLVPQGRQCGRAINRAVEGRAAAARARGVEIELDWLEPQPSEPASSSAQVAEAPSL
jgi:hypothetical protein